MASAIRTIVDAQDTAAMWLARYRSAAPDGDRAARHANWPAVFGEIAQASQGDLAELARRAARQVDEIGGTTSAGEASLRVPLSPIPLAIGAREWTTIAAGIRQRADLLERLLDDTYGEQRLTQDGAMPAACLNGSPQFLRPMVGVTPVRGRRLHVYAVDLEQGRDGVWRVVADHLQSPVGTGQALENRLALARVLPGLQTRLHVERLAPFFADLRAGLAASCRRVDPRIALLGSRSGSAADIEQAHLARYLGLMLVEASDLTTHGGRVYLRTVQGLKRVDALWHGLDARLLDPLALDSTSRVGVAGLVDAIAEQEVSVVNAPGVGVLESRAIATRLPGLCERLTGAPLALVQVERWWCGDDDARAFVAANLATLTIAPAFIAKPRALHGGALPGGARAGTSPTPDERQALLADLNARPVDYVGERSVDAATLPAVVDGRVVARPFSLRVFAARDAAGAWNVMPGGLVSLASRADGSQDALVTDLIVVADAPVAPATLMPSTAQVTLRRNPGTLPSRVADNLFWLGRYLERAEATLALVRGAFGGSSDVDGGATLDAASRARLDAMLIASGAATPRSLDVVAAALDDAAQPTSVASLLQSARSIAARSRERLSAEVLRLLDRPIPATGLAAARANELAERLQALAGLISEHMTRGVGWRFLDLGRRIERAVSICRLLRGFGGDGASADDLALLLGLTDSAMSYRQRYPTGLSAQAVRDLVALDPSNPRGLAFQIDALAAHLEALPRLADDGMAEPQQARARALAARMATHDAARWHGDAIEVIEHDLLGLSDAVAARFFPRGDVPLRAAGLTLG